MLWGTGEDRAVGPDGISYLFNLDTGFTHLRPQGKNSCGKCLSPHAQD